MSFPLKPNRLTGRCQFKILRNSCHLSPISGSPRTWGRGLSRDTPTFGLPCCRLPSEGAQAGLHSAGLGAGDLLPRQRAMTGKWCPWNEAHTRPHLPTRKWAFIANDEENGGQHAIQDRDGGSSLPWDSLRCLAVASVLAEKSGPCEPWFDGDSGICPLPSPPPACGEADEWAAKGAVREAALIRASLQLTGQAAGRQRRAH